jgi:hypothetical protein
LCRVHASRITHFTRLCVDVQPFPSHPSSCLSTISAATTVKAQKLGNARLLFMYTTVDNFAISHTNPR